MATLRATVRIDRPADAVWAVVSDAGSISSWFTGITASRLEGAVRTIELGPGMELVEDVVTNDPDLRRFQYAITKAPFPIDRHLGTVDVLDVDGSTLVVYSTEIAPDDLAAVMGPSVEGGLAGLKEFCEKQ
ncbi:MAG TPA: SRPBCC family protein [Mycobacteriales bacterium]